MSANIFASSLEKRDQQLQEDVKRNPYNLKGWIRYIQLLSDSSVVKRYGAYEQALEYLPRSYKLWHAYLIDRMEWLEGLHLSPTDSRYTNLINTFERSLIHMNKMPRIWVEYGSLLTRMRKGTSARRVFDRALQALPLMQHGAIWDIYLSWTRDFGVTEVTIKIYKRYIMFDPSFREDYISYLEDEGQYEEAVRQLAICVDDEQFISRKDQSKYQLWMKICDISADHPKDAIRAINVEAVIRSGISRFSDEVGKLWCRLADFYIRQGQFEMARNIFEEGINSVVTVRDFTIIFDSYVKVEESIITEKMRQSKSSGNDDELTEGILDADDIEMRLARLEFLMEKRPLLVNSVVLRQNPHNVFEWHKRVKLNKASPKKMLLTFIEAVKTVDTKLATGKLSTIWLAFAKFYEKQKDFGNAREIYSQATQVNFKSVDELANIWCAWAEMEINNGGYKEALALLQQAVKEPASTIKRRKAQASAVGKGMTSEQFEGSMTSDKLYRNTKVWGFYLDVEESIGSTSSCRAAYDRAMELKIVTPNMALNYATYLENHHFYEDSFKVYEQSIALFAFPPVKIIWMKYLDKFIERYGGTKLERLRDLFEQSLKSLPSDDAPEFYIKYAKTEEKYGLERHAMAVYDRATRVVPEAKRIDLYRLYIKKVEIYFGITKTRPVYERAIQELGDEASRSICLEFAEMERKLGEIDRARLILQHGSQLADPRKEKAYWRFWKDFEETHGNEDTFRDMLRIQRSVEASFSQVNYLAAEMIAGESIANATISDLESMAKLAEKESLKRKFVPGNDENKQVANKSRAVVTDAEINIDDVFSDDIISERAIPAAVYGLAIPANGSQ